MGICLPTHWYQTRQPNLVTREILSILWTLMHNNFLHFDPYHMVQVKSLVEQLHFVWPAVGGSTIDRRLPGCEDCLCRMTCLFAWIIEPLSHLCFYSLLQELHSKVTQNQNYCSSFLLSLLQIIIWLWCESVLTLVHVLFWIERCSLCYALWCTDVLGSE